MKLFSSIDALSYEQHIMFNMNRRVKTVIGGLLTLLLSTISIAGFSYFSMDVFSKTNPTVIQNKFHSDLQNITLSRSNFFLMMGILTSGSAYLDDPDTYYQLYVTHPHYYYENDAATGKSTLMLNRTLIPMVSCDKEALGAFYSSLSNIPLEKFQCLAKEAEVIMMNPYDNIGENSYINAYYTICRNETVPKGKVCKSEEEIQKKIGLYNSRIGISDYYPDHDNYTNPMQEFLNQIGTTGDTSTYKRVYNNFGNIVYKTDIGLMFENFEEIKHFAYQGQTFLVENRPESKKVYSRAFHQVTITYSAAGFHDYYFRKYKKIQNAMADIGGFIKICSLFSSVICYLLSIVQYYFEIFSRCYMLFSISISKINQSSQISNNNFMSKIAINEESLENRAQTNES